MVKGRKGIYRSKKKLLPEQLCAGPIVHALQISQNTLLKHLAVYSFYHASMSSTHCGVFTRRTQSLFEYWVLPLCYYTSIPSSSLQRARKVLYTKEKWLLRHRKVPMLTQSSISQHLHQCWASKCGVVANSFAAIAQDEVCLSRKHTCRHDSLEWPNTFINSNHL